jgi:hypothetical protein
MKHSFLLLFFAIIYVTAFATIRTVSNVDSSAQFRTIQDACDASVNGDSIYVSRSSITYAGFSIFNIKLAIFGPGWSPFVPGKAMVEGCTMRGVKTAGSELHGLYFTDDVNVITTGINNLLFYRNHFRSIYIRNVTVSNYIFEGNWFDNGAIDNYQSAVSNFTIRNNLFYNSSINYTSGGGSIVINHNLWYASSSRTCFYSCSNLTISNNIFDRNDASGTSLSYFNNNITHNTSFDAPWNTNSNTNSGGNIAGVDPQMADQTSVNNGVNNPQLNFTIAAGSANNTASDGKDMGLLYDPGGVVNWARCGASNIPYITQFNITNQTIYTNSYIRFNAQAKSN